MSIELASLIFFKYISSKHSYYNTKYSAYYNIKCRIIKLTMRV